MINVVLTGGLDAPFTVEGEVVCVEFVNSKHDDIPASLDSLSQHLSIVQKPALLGIGCICSKENIWHLAWQKCNEC
jgi:hypothetical protein